MENLTPVFVLLAGIVIGGLAIWFLRSSQVAGAYEKAKTETQAEKATLAERLNAREEALAQLDSSLGAAQAEIADLGQQLRSETARLSEQLRAESAARASETEKAAAGAQRVSQLETGLAERERIAQELQSEISNLKAQRSELDTRLGEERKAAQEKLTLLTAARNELTEQFQNLANAILDEKSKKFTEQNKSNIEALLTPLGLTIREFQSKVETTHVEDTKQRSSLLTQLEGLKLLNTRISEDAINLTNALKGQTKTQGNWGEQILETILQNAGLVKGQHYDVQVSVTTDEGRRVQPDLILHLPEGRHIVVDSKVNLTAYTRFCEMTDGPEREGELKKHVAAFRTHVSDLSNKQYQDHYKLNSLEFVLMFVPLEPAFMLALQTDESIYDFAFQKRISIVTPSTLHAAVHTVSNIWRQDNQNKHAIRIAEEAGKLYDKFVAFTGDLEDIGAKLQTTQKSYDAAHNKLISGKGNLVTRAENIRQLGAKASKRLSVNLLGTTDDDGRSGEIESELEIEGDELAN